MRGDEEKEDKRKVERMTHTKRGKEKRVERVNSKKRGNTLQGV